MMIPRKALPRRTVLRGLMGAAVALPVLEAMSPTAKAADAAAAARKRFQVIYTPNGYIMQNFRPAELGANYTISPILKPMEPFRDKFAVLSGFDHVQAEALGDGAGDHARCCGTFLTGMHVHKSESVISNGISADQVAAREFGKITQLPSMEFGLEQPSLVGGCDSGYSCAYTNTMSWTGPTTPLPTTINPRDIFERLFGDGDVVDAKTRMAVLRRQASLLNFVAQDAKRLSGDLGASDKQKIDEYLTAVREIEQRIQRAEQHGSEAALPAMARPSAIPVSYSEYARMMIDLQVLAYQADMTRVITFMVGREGSPHSYPETGVADGHHPLSHHGNDPDKMARLTLINTYHWEQIAYWFKRMSETKEGDKSLLDSTLILAGASLADPNRHDHRDLGIIAGGGLIKGGYHAKANNVPMTNLLLSMMDVLGVQQDKLGDSTGRVEGLAAGIA
jgi:hypothetical protein